MRNKSNIIKNGLLFSIVIFWFLIPVRSQLSVSFSAAQTTGCVPFAVQFTSQFTGGTAISYAWDFGNGNTSGLANPVAFYNLPGVYTVTLTVSNGVETATAQIPAYITVNLGPQASFTASMGSAGCQWQDWTFTSTSQAGTAPITGYQWIFGDGATAIMNTENHTYQTPGTFDVTLIVTSADGCQSSATQNSLVTVLPSTVDAAFSAPQTSACQIPFTVNFQNQSVAPPGSTFLWNFGNGQTSNQENPSITYFSAGSYPVSLIVTDPSTGCSDTAVYSSFVTLTTVALAAFQLSENSVCPGKNIQTQNQSIPASATFNWDFGNGQTSTSAQPTFSYSQPGTYTVSLTVTAGNCTAQTAQTVTVHPGPQASFSATPTEACQLPASFSFTNTSTGATSYQWSFGGAAAGSTVTNPVITVANFGTFSVRLIAINSFGCQDTLFLQNYLQVQPLQVMLTANPPGSCVLPQTVTFSASPSNPNYNLTSYQWQFSNGMTSNLANPSITFTNPGFYGATLVATSSQGCVDTVENAQLVSLSDGQVIPSFTLNPTQVCAGYPVQFLNTSLGGVDFTWLVNGSIYSNQLSLNPTFYYPDTLEVALVGSAPGCVGDTSDVQTLFILPSSAYYTAQRTCDGSNTVTFSGFDASASSLWLYPGDGSSVNVTGLTSYVHTYSPGATYSSYALSQNNQSGCQDTFNRVLFIPNFNLDFTISPTSGCAPLPVTLTSATTGFSSIRWGFGNGQLSPLIGINASNPVSTVNYTYPNPGTYNVFLVGNYNFGGGHICRDTLFQTLEVFPVPHPQIQVLSHTGCGPVTMAFQASAPAGSTLLWDFGDGTTSTEWQPVHTFLNFGGNTVVLHATQNGCEGTDTLSGYEFYSQAPNAQVVVSPTQACPWTQVNLTGFITGNYSTAFWNFGDGTTGAGSFQTHAYSNTGQFLPSLNVLDTLGCLYTFNALDTVYVTQPVASFPPPFVQQACPPVVVSFSNNSQNAVSYLWDFGNGATSSQPSPTTTYTLPGSYQPQLIVWDIYGCTDTLQAATGSLVVAGPVLEELVISDPTPCPGQPVHFEIQSPNATVFILNVDTTGLYVVGSSVSFTYNSAGMYFPFVTLGTQAGNQFCLVNFPQDTLVVAPLDISVSSPPPACRGSLFPVSAANADFYQWAPPHLFPFGNSGAFSSALPDSSGWVWVTGTDTNGCADTDSLWLEVYPKPNASFAYTNSCVYSPLSFSNTSVSQTPVVQYHWNFGNQGLSALENPVFVFTSPGLHPVSLVIQTTQGCLDTAEATVEIYPLPVAQFSTSGTCAGAPVQWENVSSVPSPYFLQNTTWILDGQILGASLPAPFYLSEGLHNLTLITESNTGCRDTLSQIIQIFPQPQASFSISNSLACSGEPVIFTDQSFFLENSGNLTWYIYDVNGNAHVLTTAPGGQTSYLPQSSGDHNVMLVATSVYGCTDTLSGQGFFFVSPPVMAAFELNPSQMSILQPQVTVVNQSIGYDNLLWTFGDGFSSTNEAVQHTYQEPGEYKVTLVATNVYGCQDDTTALVAVLPEPLLYVPNAFSPGVLDGINDYFSVKGIGIQEFQITIFDRWGEKIFESNDLSFAWDGTYKGQVVPQGAYVYRIEVVDMYAKVYDLHGTITVIH